MSLMGRLVGIEAANEDYNIMGYMAYCERRGGASKARDGDNSSAAVVFNNIGGRVEGVAAVDNEGNALSALVVHICAKREALADMERERRARKKKEKREAAKR